MHLWQYALSSHPLQAYRSERLIDLRYRSSAHGSRRQIESKLDSLRLPNFIGNMIHGKTSPWGEIEQLAFPALQSCGPCSPVEPGVSGCQPQFSSVSPPGSYWKGKSEPVLDGAIPMLMSALAPRLSTNPSICGNSCTLVCITVVCTVGTTPAATSNRMPSRVF